METLIQQCVNAVSLGGTYALLAVRLAVVFSVLGMINFAHGEILTIAGYTVFFCLSLGVPSILIIPLALLAAAGAAALMERIAFRPLRGATGTTLLLTSFAVSGILQVLFQNFISTRPRPVPIPESLAGAIAIGALPGYVRLTRAAALGEIGRDYVTASRVAGAGVWRLMFITVLPNCLAPLIVNATLSFSSAILETAGLGFLGLGVQAPTPEWGTMLSSARDYIARASWVVTLPGLTILVTLVNFVAAHLQLKNTLKQAKEEMDAAAKAAQAEARSKSKAQVRKDTTPSASASKPSQPAKTPTEPAPPPPPRTASLFDVTAAAPAPAASTAVPVKTEPVEADPVEEDEEDILSEINDEETNEDTSLDEAA